MMLRPLAGLSFDALFTRARTAAAQVPSDIDTMLHCWAEASQRHVMLQDSMRLRLLFDKVNCAGASRFFDADIEPPEWYLDAFNEAQALKRGRSPKENRRVYVLLLRGPPGAKRQSEIGLYVGETYLPAEERLTQHIGGIHASGAARRGAIAVLPSFCPHLVHLSHQHSKRLEAELAERLRTVLARYRLPPSRVQGGH